MTKVDWLGIGRASTELVGHIVANSDLLRRSVVRDFQQVRSDAASAYNGTLADLRELGATFRASPRYLRLATLAARIAARYQVASIREERLAAAGIIDQGILEAAHQRSADDVLEVCRELGGGVLKVGQLLSARADLLPPAYITALSTLQDRAPARPFEEIEPVISASLGDAIERLEKVEPEALAAASLAQVHSARLRDGREVVLKVRRPGVEALVQADLRALSLISHMLVDTIPGIDVETMVAEVSRFLTDELDFGLEARRLEAFAEQARLDPRWHVPAIVPELCGGDVIVMERIHGVSLTKHLEDADEDERTRVIGLIVAALSTQVLRHGLAHGDPHPGNLMIDRDGHLVMVDFGCVLEVSPTVRQAYVGLVMAILARNEEAIALALEAAGFEATNDGALVKMASLFLEAFEDGMLEELDPAEQAARGLELAREAGDIKVPSSFVLIARIFALVGGFVIHYRPHIELGPLLADALRPSSSSSSHASSQTSKETHGPMVEPLNRA